MTHENDRLSPEEEAKIEAMRPDHRLRARYEQRRFEKSRQARRDARDRAVVAGGVGHLEARTFAAEVAAWSMKPETLAVALFNQDFAKRVDALRERAGVAVLSSAAISGAMTAAMEQIDPESFQRRVQIRRRHAALKQRKASR